jgi:hypothetical protein
MLGAILRWDVRRRDFVFHRGGAEGAEKERNSGRRRGCVIVKFEFRRKSMGEPPMRQGEDIYIAGKICGLDGFDDWGNGE